MIDRLWDPSSRQRSVSRQGFTEPLPEIQRPLASRYYHLSGTLEWVGKYGRFLVPRTFRTDLASVPWFVRWFVPSDGAYEAACILHDYCIDDLRARLAAGLPVDPCEWNGPLINGRQTDEVFRLTLEELGTPWFKRWLMWTGVRWASPFDEARRSGGVVRDLPLMVLFGASVLPILVLGTVPMLLALAFYWIVEGLAEAVEGMGGDG